MKRKEGENGMPEQHVNATLIKTALSVQHRKDFFCTECKNGPTHNPPAVGLLILDAVAVRKSWSNPSITGYEIKISRGDFRRDGKWHCYLPYCHEFYFVCPTGLIKKEELPDNVGLKYYNPDTGALRTVKKALYRKIEVSADMLMYILMNKVDSDRTPFYSSRADYARAYIEHKEYCRNAGYELGTHFAKEISRASGLVAKNEELMEEARKFSAITNVMRQHGLYRYCDTEEQAAEKLDQVLRMKAPKEMKQIQQKVQELYQLIATIQQTD